MSGRGWVAEGGPTHTHSYTGTRRLAGRKGKTKEMKLHGYPGAGEIRKAFGRLLAEWPWQFYLTWTFRDRVGPVKALHEVQQHLRFMSWGLQGEIGWVVGLEQEHGADRPHAHGLVCGPQLIQPVMLYRGWPVEHKVLRIEPYWRAWMDRNGAGRFELVRGPVNAVSFYCAKHAVRDGELLISDNLEKFRPREFQPRRGMRRPPASEHSSTNQVS